MGIDNLLAASLMADVNRAYQDNPWYSAGSQIAEAPIQYNPYVDKPGNWITAGLLKGIAGGLSEGLGEAGTTDTLRPKFTSLAESLGPAGAGYLKLVQSSDWNPRGDMGPLVQALQAKEMSDAVLAKQNEIMLRALMERSNKLFDFNLENGLSAGVVPGVPAKYTKEALEEQKSLDTASKLQKTIGSAFDDFLTINPLAANIPLSDDSAKSDAARAMIVAEIQKNWKGPMSDQDVKRIEGLLPYSYDSVDRLAIKKAKMMEFLGANAGGTPVLDRYRLKEDAATMRQAMGNGPMPKPKPSDFKTKEEFIAAGRAWEAANGN